MIEVTQFMIETLTRIFNMLLDKGDVIGVAIVCWPLFSRIVRALRSIIPH